MKSTVLKFAIAAIASFVLSDQSKAQDNPPVLIEDFTPDLSIPIAINKSTGSDLASERKVHFRALKDFKKEFGGVTNAEWTKTFDGGYVARFDDNSINTMVAYSGKGRWNHTINRYDENLLPADVRKVVKSTYYDYDIFNVIEVKVIDRVVYMVYIGAKDNWKVIRVSDGDMQEVADYVRG